VITLNRDMIDLRLGDCLQTLPTIGSVDTVITDPIWPNAPEGMFPCDNPQQLLADALALIECKRLVIILRGDSDPRFLQAVPDTLPFFRCQILEYVMPGYIGRKLGGDEIAYCFGEPLPSAPGRRVIPGRAPKAQPVHRKANGHPCSRALLHMTWLVQWWSLPGETVLDPFMGSGTTGVVAVQLDRNFIGCEINEEWFRIAEKRIEECQKPLPGMYPDEEQ
jgi:site-specific DNA-methyltransferase (adenine-specific)